MFCRERAFQQIAEAAVKAVWAHERVAPTPIAASSSSFSGPAGHNDVLSREAVSQRRARRACESMWMSVQAYASDVATVPKGHVMNSTGESRESWCSKKDAWETQSGKPRQRRHMGNPNGPTEAEARHEKQPKRHNRFRRCLQEQT